MNIPSKLKFIKKVFLIIIPGLLIALPVWAQYGLEETAGEAKLKTGIASMSIPQIVGSVIGVFLGLLGVIFMILLVYGGYTWMTSYGNQEKVNKAKEVITSAIIGLIIVLGAYAISSFVINALV